MKSPESHPKLLPSLFLTTKDYSIMLLTDGYVAGCSAIALTELMSGRNLSEGQRLAIQDGVDFLVSAKQGYQRHIQPGLFLYTGARHLRAQETVEVLDGNVDEFSWDVELSKEERILAKLDELSATLKIALESGRVTQKQLSEAKTFFKGLQEVITEQKASLEKR